MRDERRSSHSRAARTVALASLIALQGACTDRQSYEAPVAERIQTPDQLASLPLLAVSEQSDACPPDASACHPNQARVAASSANGWVVVAGEKQKQSQLYRFSPEGHQATAIGRQGGGPGEYHVLAALHIDSTGAISAFDLLQRRLLRYESDGRPGTATIVQLPDGFIHAAVASEGFVAVATDPRRASGDSAGVSVYRLDGTAARFVRRAMLPVTGRAFRLDDLRPVPAPFAARHLWAVDQSGRIYFADGEQHRISAFDSLGTHVLRFGASTTPREVTRADLEAELAERLKRIPAGPMQDALRASAQSWATRHPAITRLTALANGQVWVRESPREAGDSVQWVAYSGADGQPLGRMILAADDDVLASAGDELLMFVAEGPSGDATLRWVTVKR